MRLVRTWLLDTLSRSTIFVVLALMVGALYPTPDYMPFWLNAVIVGGGVALMLLLIYRDNIFGARGGKSHIRGFLFTIGTLLILGVWLSPSGEPWWVGVSFPMAISMIPPLVSRGLSADARESRAERASKAS